MNNEEILNKLNEHEERIRNLESKHPHSLQQVANGKNKSTGVLGAVEEMANEGFFDKPQEVKAAKDELERRAFFDSLQIVDRTIRINMYKNRKILNRVKQNGKWAYFKKR